LSPVVEKLFGFDFGVAGRNMSVLQSMFGPNIAANTWISQYVDMFVIPITAASFFGMSYAHSLYNNWLSLMSEGRRGRLLTASVMVSTYVCGVLSVLLPQYWLMIGMVPVVVWGVKLYQITRMDRLATVAKTYVHTLHKTIFYSGAILFGTGFYLSKYIGNAILTGDNLDAVFVWNFCIGAFVCLYFIHGRNLHVAPDPAAEVLGLIDRTMMQ
jgi:hypothetical protein